MSRSILHYIYDPLCGWCYAVAPLVAAAGHIDGLTLEFHGGGLMSGPARCRVTPDLRNYVMIHDRRIAELTGQPFGDDYFNGLLLDVDAVFDSTPPIAAIRASQACGHSAAAMLSALQHAHFVEGQRIADEVTLQMLAAALGIDQEVFAAELQRQISGSANEHIQAGRQRLQAAGGGGFPKLILETKTTMRRVDTHGYLGRPTEWRQMLVSALGE